MNAASIWYLGVTFLLFVIFTVIVARTYRKKNRERGEEPKYRMLEDEREGKNVR